MKVTSDLHIHTNLSLCAEPDATVERYLALWAENDVRTIGFSNHCWAGHIPFPNGVCPGVDWYKAQPVERALTIRKQLPKDTGSKRILIGCEVEYIGSGIAGIDKDTAKLFDYVLVAANHFHMTGLTVPSDLVSGGTDAIRELLYRRFNEAAALEFATGIVHPFIPYGFSDIETEIISGFTDQQYRNSFSAAASCRISVEIHRDAVESRIAEDKNGFSSEFIRMLTIAGECGCTFHFGSDTHGIINPDYERMGRFAALCGITSDDILVI